MSRPKASQILDKTWFEHRFFAESVPHFLSWDLLYLWILEKDPGIRPESWRQKIEAWRFLVTMVFANQVRIEEEPLTPPLCTYAEPHGIDRVSWVVSRRNRKVGVLSPTVIVRPLPEFEDEHLHHWRRGEVGRTSEELNQKARVHLVDTAEILERNFGMGSYGDRLAKVLRSEFQLVETEDGARQGRIHRKFPVLESYGWTSRRAPGDLLAEVELPMEPGSGETGGTLDLHCKPCGQLLYRKSDAAPIHPKDGHLEIECPNCHHVQKFPLEELLVWERPGTDEVILWAPDASIRRDLDAVLPPDPTIDGGGNNQLLFEWPAASISGSNKAERYLRLEFRGRRVRRVDVAEVFYRKLLVAGSAEGFRGIPIRLEWLDAVHLHLLRPAEKQEGSSTLKYQDIRLHGIPATFTKIFGGNAIQVVPDLLPGIFPDPRKVNRSWRRFRYFLAGDSKSSFEIVAPGARHKISHVTEIELDPEADSCHFAVTSPGDDGFGVTFWTGREAKGGEVANKIEYFFGLDFGTTHSLVYCAPDNQEAANPDADKHAARPQELHRAIDWLAGGSDPKDARPAFLPAVTDLDGREDPHLFPSALWLLPGEGNWIVRWSARPPHADAEARTGFKWGAGNHSFRRGFLEELLYLVTAHLVAAKDLRHSNAMEIHLGVAFPLAFGVPERTQLVSLLEELVEELRLAIGVSFEVYSISEAMACVEAQGELNPGTSYLVADLGGSTLDLALFTPTSASGAPEMKQLGSVKFAGEVFIRALAEAKEQRSSRQDEMAWTIRDAVATGQSRKRFDGDRDALTILPRFRVFIAEFLRLMGAAHRQHLGEDWDSAIHLVMAGNGWQLSGAFDPKMEGKTPYRIFEEIYRPLLKKMDDGNLELFLSSEMQDLPSPKHFVVRGALLNAGLQGRHQLAKANSSEESKLPAGRAMILSNFGKDKAEEVVVRWHDLVGEGVSLPGGKSQAELDAARKQFELIEIPAASDSWLEYLLPNFDIHDDDPSKVPYPSGARLLAGIALHGDPEAKLERGPMQVILEVAWKKFLSKSR